MQVLLIILAVVGVGGILLGAALLATFFWMLVKGEHFGPWG